MNDYCNHLTSIFIAAPTTRPSCPPDVPLVSCINAPTACEEATCPNFPNARCIFDNCGDCHTKFFIGNRDVTDRCGKSPVCCV